MRSLFFLLLLHFCTNGFCQENQKIEGHFVGYSAADTLSLFVEQIPGQYVDRPQMQLVLRDGAFVLDNSFSYPHLYFSLLASDKGKIFIRNKLLFIDPDTRHITIDYTNWESSRVDGATAIEYETVFKPRAFKTLDISSENELTALLYHNFNKIDTLLYSYAKEHPSSFIPLWIMAQRFHFLGYSDIGAQTLSQFDESVRRTPVWAKLSQDLHAAAIRKDAAFPKMKVENLQGEELQLALPTAKLTLVDFWFSFCKPCLASIPAMREMYAAYKHHGFEIVGISTDSQFTKKKWLATIEEKGMIWPQFLDVGGKETKNMKINLFPRYLLLDEDGKIIEADVGITALEKIIKERLGLH